MSDNWKLNTPVVLMIFNRPDTTAKVFQEIARAKPSKLLVIADGPRTDRPNEAEKCLATRQIIEQVDWDCEITKNYSDVNLGCKRRVSSGLNWVFEREDHAIILEDDCIPHPTFFRFCDELLEKYHDDQRIMMISGDNFQFGHKRTHYSYYFSRYTHIWGWATWRRAWQYYDVEMKLWPLIREEAWIKDIFRNGQYARRWEKTFEVMYNGLVDTWDNQWLFTCWTQHGLSILPNTNLISNIGFNAEATHTTSSTNSLANMPTEAMDFPLQHPPFIIRDANADAFTEKRIYSPTLISLLPRGIAKLKRLIKHYLRG